MLTEFFAGIEFGAIIGIWVCTLDHRVETFEWLAHKRGPHTAFERSTMTAGRYTIRRDPMSLRSRQGRTSTPQQQTAMGKASS